MKHIHLAIASTTSMPGDVTGNLKQIVGFAHRAAQDGAHLLLTAELSASGYGNTPEIFATAEVAGQGPIFDELAQAAHDTGIVICAGFVERREEKTHLSHYAVFPDGKYVVQRKNCITPAEKPMEPYIPPDATPGKVHLEIFEVHGVRCAIVICADSGYEDLHDTLAAHGVQVHLLVSAAGGALKDRITTPELKTIAGREKYMKILETVFFPGEIITDCIQYRKTFAGVNLCGYDGQKFCHMGHGMLVNPMGEVVGLFHGLPNRDRHRPMYAHAEIDVDDCLDGEIEEG